MEEGQSGFSPDFNWQTLKQTRVTEQDALFVSELRRIERKVTQDAKDSRMDDSIFTFSAKLSNENTIKLFKELCSRFPGRVWAADSDGRWTIDPNKIIWGSTYGINLQ